MVRDRKQGFCLSNGFANGWCSQDQPNARTVDMGLKDRMLGDGAPGEPTNTWFQFEPFHDPICELRVKNCCWDPDWICPSIFESAMNPPEDQPPSDRARFPRTCIRR